MANLIPVTTSLRNQTHRNHQNNLMIPTTVFYNKNLLHQQYVAPVQQHQQHQYQQYYTQRRIPLPGIHYPAFTAQQVMFNANYAYQWSNLVAVQHRQINYKNYQTIQSPQLFQNIRQQIETNNVGTNTNENAPPSPSKKMKQNKDDTVQRNSSKVAHNNNHHHSHHHRKSRKDHQQGQQQLMKNDSSDSGLSVNGQQQRHHHHQHHLHHQQQQNQQHNRNNLNQSKSRYIKQHQNGQQRSIQKPTSGFSMDDWLENGEMVYYERRRFESSSDEDKLGRRHNAGHRNSTSSDTTPSEDLTTSSSNEDLRDSSYTVSPKCKKNASKSRQRRQQQKRKKQLSESGNSNHDENEDAMDVDIGSVKENCHPNNASMQQRKNLRQDCSKNAAPKVINGNKNTAKSVNVLKSSNSNANSKRSSASPSSSSSAISSSSVDNSPTASPTTSKRNAENLKKIALQLTPPLRSYMNMKFTEIELVQHLRRYIIDQNLLRVYGYPVESAIHEGCIEIYKCLPKPQNATSNHHHHHHNHQNQQQHHHGQQQQMQLTQHFVSNASVINVNDGLCVNISTCHKNDYQLQWTALDDTCHSATDSGQGSGNSSPPSMDSDTSEGTEDEPSSTTALYTPDGSYQIFSQYDQSMEKQCVRCNRTFHVTANGEYLNREACTFHWGKLNQIYSGEKGYCFQYTCCLGDQESQGCVHNDLHVWTGAVVGLNGPYTDFLHTRMRCDSTGPTKIYALDCEMSFTGRGLEVTKITVVGYDGQLVYEHFVRPDAEIVDYNTRFSGITEKDLSSNSNNSVKTLTEVQRDLLRLFDADTILIGHAIDNDLRVLRIVHKTIIDTSICFPHASGFPYRRALKHLTKVYLHRDIQTSDAGHSSFEDARACLELMLWKVRKEMR